MRARQSLRRPILLVALSCIGLVLLLTFSNAPPRRTATVTNADGPAASQPAAAGLDRLVVGPAGASDVGVITASGWAQPNLLGGVAVLLVADGHTLARAETTGWRPDVTQALGVLDAMGWRLAYDGMARPACIVTTTATPAADDNTVVLGCVNEPDERSGPVAGSSGPLITYSVEVHPETGFGIDETAAIIHAVLSDSRSWTGNGTVRFQRVALADAAIIVVLALPDEVDRLCAPLPTRGETSCQIGNSVILNARRWAEAVPHWTLGLAQYRTYLVNHEFGHVLGMDHQPCTGVGAQAPVMLQQTIGLDGCVPNPYPYPGENP